jgi:outer membrane protein TolC
VPFADARGRLQLARLTRKEARDRRESNEARLTQLLGDFRSLGLDPVVIGDAAPQAVLAQFAGWAEARLANRRGEWR